ALACCSSVATSARSCALRIRSPRINVCENESRICVGLIRDTPPPVGFSQTQPGLGDPYYRGRSTTIYRKPVDNQEKSLSSAIASSRLPLSHGADHRLEHLHPVRAAQFGFG